MRNESALCRLEDGSRIAVVGGGPSGSFFSYFLLDMVKALGLKVELDIYEPRDFSKEGPAGCNMCGGIISESLVQNLAAEGINLPMTVAKQRPGVTWRPMSTVLWDMFTGSAPYREIFIRTLHPVFLVRLVLALARSVLPGGRAVVKEGQWKLEG